ncbi:MAG: PDZ domain-containing protein, partial [Longimicrobiales bacterium]
MRLRSVRQTAALVAASIVFCTSSGYAQIARPGSIVTIAQAPPPHPVERGWIGIGVDLTVAEPGRGTPNLVVRIVRTVDGSPAAVAGVVPGDVIRSIDGELLTVEAWQSFTQNLRRGTDLRLVLDRGGRTREVRLTTALRPSLAPVPVGFTDHLDSVRTSFQSRLRSNRSVWSS